MVSEEDKNENLTSEEYRQKADEHMDALKQEWSVFGKTGIIILAALFAIIVACIAWFASNREVSGTGMSIQASGSDFELAAAGDTVDTGKYDGMLGSGQGVSITSGNTSYMVTDGSHTSISWAITDNSNMGNKNAAGINPGSSGKLTFYIIAQKTGSLTVTLDLTLTGYRESTNTVGSSTSPVLEEAGKDDADQQLLEGHILLFAGYDDSSKSYSGWISDDADEWTMTLGNDTDYIADLTRNENGKLSWTANVVKGTAYPVTIYWIWPEVVGSYLMRDHTYIGGRPVLFPKDTTANDPEALPGGLFEKMCESSNSSGTISSNRYFKWALENSEDFTNFVTEEVLGSMRSNDFHTKKYGILCSYYNAADQYLGENIRYVKLTLDAQ